MLLIVCGLIGLFVCAILTIPLVFDQDMFVRLMKDFVAKQPAGQQKQELEQKIQDAENELNANRDALAMEHIIELALWGCLNLLAIIGGFSMRRLGSYGLSMCGAIVSLIPCAVACCPLVGIPVGLWALVVLLRPEVKAAFVANRSSGRMVNPDDQYMR